MARTLLLLAAAAALVAAENTPDVKQETATEPKSEEKTAAEPKKAEHAPTQVETAAQKHAEEREEAEAAATRTENEAVHRADTAYEAIQQMNTELEAIGKSSTTVAELARRIDARASAQFQPRGAEIVRSYEEQMASLQQRAAAPTSQSVPEISKQAFKDVADRMENLQAELRKVGRERRREVRRQTEEARRARTRDARQLQRAGEMAAREVIRVGRREEAVRRKAGIKQDLYEHASLKMEVKGEDMETRAELAGEHSQRLIEDLYAQVHKELDRREEAADRQASEQRRQQEKTMHELIQGEELRAPLARIEQKLQQVEGRFAGTEEGAAVKAPVKATAAAVKAPVKATAAKGEASQVQLLSTAKGATSTFPFLFMTMLGGLVLFAGYTEFRRRTQPRVIEPPLLG